MTPPPSNWGGLSLREFLTPQSMWARYEELCNERPDVRTTRYILGNREAQLEWLNSVGVAQDAAVAACVAPVPPRELRQKVADPDVEAFLWTGFVDIVTILTVLEKHHNVRTASALDVLDFGCGCGRLLRFLQPMAKRWNIVGADANGELASWSLEHLHPISIIKNGVDGPLTLPSERFDLIYCLSVFTHLSENKALRWLHELTRLLRPGGVLVATIHGESALNTIRTSPVHQSMFAMTETQAGIVAERLASDGFVYRAYDNDLLGLADVGSEYGNSFTSPSYVGQRWASTSLELCDVIPAGLRGWQDLVVLRRLA
jgi:2-polyprenyl-3-methyl-5-hydroxy-6-metoxy-1,4-benzoquinol methylase